MFEINERLMDNAATAVGEILDGRRDITIHTVTLQIDGGPGCVRMKVEATDDEFNDDVSFEVTL